MKIHTVIMDLGPGEGLTAILHNPGLLRLSLGPDASLWVKRATNPEVYAELCEQYGLQNETAPGDQTEDGDTLGNEPGVEMVPQKVQV